MREMWNTKVFVDKLPKSCNDCVIDHCGEWCFLNSVDIDTWSYNETRPKECPLKSLTDYTKQVRKEVVQEIWTEFEQRLMNTTQDMPIMKVANMINSVLDQIKGKGEINYGINNVEKNCK